MNKPISGSSAQLKAQINDLTQARVNIEKGRQISDSMIKLTKTLTNIKPLLKNQQGYIKNFFGNQQSSSPQNKQSQNRRVLNRLCQCAMNQISDMLDVSEQYFTLDFKNSWNKIKNNFEKEFNAARQQIDQKNIIDFLFKIINVKDYFITLFMRSFLYRQILMWKDLNIVQAGYIHAQKKSIVKLIQEQIMHKGYVPTKPVFDWMGLNIKGKWSMNKLDATQYDLKTMTKLTNESMQNVFSVLRNFAGLNVQQRLHQDIDRNKQQVKSLRQEIEQSKINYMNLQKKYRQAVLKDQKSDLVELREKVSFLQEQLQNKQNEMKRIKFQFRDSSNQINSLKQKIKELQSDLNRITNQQLKKLKELQTVQYSLNDQFVKISKNINNFGSMFEFQSEGKKSLARQIQAKEKTIEKMVQIIGKQKKKIRQQGQEITRLNCIILELGNKLRT